MKFIAFTLLLTTAFAGNSAFSQQMDADDVKWINQCVNDNKDGASAEIVRKFCICMNEKMDENETRSISEWEKSNPEARAACDEASGWK